MLFHKILRLDENTILFGTVFDYLICDSVLLKNLGEWNLWAEI